MPTLRFTRDKRGYENTFVVHTPRRRSRTRSRILYWFRTPPGVRVGRTPLDPEAIRLIEAHHPDVRFDWPQILKGEEEAPLPLPAPRPPAEPAGRGRPVPAGRGEPPPPAEPLSPVHADLGPDGLVRLRARYATVVADIARRVDPVRREAVTAQAERLNPDSWSTADEARVGLEEYEGVLQSLRDEVWGRIRPRPGG